jgi:hypothetical protein
MLSEHGCRSGSFEPICHWRASLPAVLTWPLLVLLQSENPSSNNPVVFDDGVTYMYIQHNNLYLMAVSRQNANAASLLLFLHRIVDVSDTLLPTCPCP